MNERTETVQHTQGGSHAPFGANRARHSEFRATHQKQQPLAPRPPLRPCRRHVRLQPLHQHRHGRRRHPRLHRRRGVREAWPGPAHNIDNRITAGKF